jgi:hypothetical protein
MGYYETKYCIQHEYFSESDLVRHRIVKAADGKADFVTESAVSFHFEKAMTRPHNVRTLDAKRRLS